MAETRNTIVEAIGALAGAIEKKDDAGAAAQGLGLLSIVIIDIHRIADALEELVALQKPAGDGR